MLYYRTVRLFHTPFQSPTTVVFYAIWLLFFAGFWISDVSSNIGCFMGVRTILEANINHHVLWHLGLEVADAFLTKTTYSCRRHGSSYGPGRFDRDESTVQSIQDRIHMLESNGFDRKRSRHDSWRSTFDRLVAYKNTYGHMNVPQMYNDGNKPHLGTWVRTQRAQHSKGDSRLGQDRIQMLESIGFRWRPRQYSWKANFERLVAYKDKNGHVNVPHSYNDGSNPLLGQWIASQRTQYHKGDLTEDKIHLLESIGFQWRLRQQISWEKTFDRLVGYKDEFGHVNVPRSYNDGNNPHLGQWVSMQRFQHSKGDSRLTQDRIILLESIGFEW